MPALRISASAFDKLLLPQTRATLRFSVPLIEQREYLGNLTGNGNRLVAYPLGTPRQPVPKFQATTVLKNLLISGRNE